jgi:hypothetical protein
MSKTSELEKKKKKREQFKSSPRQIKESKKKQQKTRTKFALIATEILSNCLHSRGLGCNVVGGSEVGTEGIVVVGGEKEIGASDVGLPTGALLGVADGVFVRLVGELVGFVGAGVGPWLGAGLGALVGNPVGAWLGVALG